MFPVSAQIHFSRPFESRPMYIQISSFSRIVARFLTSFPLLTEYSIVPFTTAPFFSFGFVRTIRLLAVTV